MKEYHNYVTAGEEDINWGLYLTTAGFQEIPAGILYPPTVHPSSYFFKWNDGRILDEYQMILITEGSGVFENKKNTYSVKKGSMILLFPGEWHRYKPNEATGWNEYYLGFKGSYARQIFKHSFFNKAEQVYSVSDFSNILKLYNSIISEVINEKPGYQQVCSGHVISALGQLLSSQRNKEFEGKAVETKIREAREYMRQHATVNLDMQEVAKNMDMGYSHFRMSFKKFTGISPTQYHLMIRIQKAKDLLVSTDKSVNEIAIELGFQSIFYFTRIFTKKTGYTPTALRQKKHIFKD